MGKIVITESQFTRLKFRLSEGIDITEESKEKLFTIATLAYKMWEQIEQDDEIEDWMLDKISQTEQNIISIVKSFMYDGEDQEMKGMEKLNYNDLVIGM